ncbi:hypothetical protein F5888DRAFT_1636507 [Russula emetica]|nr:hypothetical protein F5888DRAFT_1636507 [Russula emetica]
MTSFTPLELDNARSTSQHTANAIGCISNPLTRSCVQTYTYLLGVSSEMPELTQEEIDQHQAVQSCYDAMSGVNPMLLDSQANSPEGEAFAFQIPINTTKANTPTTTVEVTFAANDIRDNIFSRICAYMDVPRGYGKLGWRLNSAQRSDPPRHFLTNQDIDSTFKEATGVRNLGKKKKCVVIEIVNTEPAIAKKTSKQKRDNIDPDITPSIMPYTKELELVKEKFWAKSLHENPTKTSCILPPNGLLTDVKKTRKPRGSSSYSCATTEPAAPMIHNHVHVADFTKAPESSLSAASALQPLSNNGPSSSLAGCSLTRQHAMYFELDDKSDEGEDSFDIKKVLDQLHGRYPSVDFPQYKKSLHELGICYLVSADMFDADFYVKKAKMVEGAAHLFKAFVSKELGNIVQARGRRKEKGKKRARYDEDENITPDA